MTTSLSTQTPPSIFKKSAEEIKLRVSSFGSKLTSVEAYQEISAAIVGIASSIKRVKEHYDPKIADARVPWDNLCQEKKDVLDTIASAQTMANRLKADYEEEDERKRLADQQVKEAEENKRIQDEAKEVAEQLKAVGDKKAAREVLAEAKATQITVVIPSTIPKTAGMYSRKPTWVYEIIDPEKINESCLHKVPNEDKIAELVKRLGLGAEQLIGKGSIKITKKIPNAVVRGAK